MTTSPRMIQVTASTYHGQYAHAMLPLADCGGAGPNDLPCPAPTAAVLAFPGTDRHGIYLSPRCVTHYAEAVTNLGSWPFVVIPRCPA